MTSKKNILSKQFSCINTPKITRTILDLSSIFHLPSFIFRRSFIFFLFSLLFFLSSSCSKKGTDPGEETVTFSGKVTLEGQTDHSGVTFALYKPVELDTALVRINEQYPNIGVQISQETEFDHREHTPVVTTVSDAGGNWKIENVAQGEYNVVASKDGFGWQYRYEVGRGSQNFDLSEVINVSGILTGNIMWESGKSYVLEGEVFVDAGATLTIEEKVWCLGKLNSRLTVNGRVIKTQTGFSHFSNDISNSGFWRGILINSSNNTLDGITLRKTTSGISIRNNSNKINNAIITGASSTGISLSQNISQCSIDKVLLDENFVGLQVSDADNTNEIKNSIIIGSNDDGISISQSDILISNNLITKNANGIICWFQSDAIIKNNDIVKNLSVGIEVSGCKPSITFNNIQSNEFQAIYITARGYNSKSEPVINRNNLSTKSQVITQIVGTIVSDNGEDIDATNNWWATTDITVLNSMIIDKNDYDPSDQVNYPYTGMILYNPLLMDKDPSAGILK